MEAPSDAAQQFEYAGFTEDETQAAKAAASRIRESFRRSLVEIGRELIEMKAMLGHGRFMAWLEGAVGMAARTAQHALAAAALNDKSAEFAHLTPSTQYALATAPAPVRSQLLETVARGEEIGPSKVRAAVDGWRRSKPRPTPESGEPAPAAAATAPGSGAATPTSPSPVAPQVQEPRGAALIGRWRENAIKLGYIETRPVTPAETHAMMAEPYQAVRAPEERPKPRKPMPGERLVDLFAAPPGYEGDGVVKNGKAVSPVAPRDTPEFVLLLRAWQETSRSNEVQIEFVSRVARDIRFLIDRIIDRQKPEALQVLQGPVDPLPGGARAAVQEVVDLVCKLRPADRKLFMQCFHTLLGHKPYSVATAVANAFARREAGDRACRDAEFDAGAPGV